MSQNLSPSPSPRPQPSLQASLKSKLLDARRVAVLAIGSELRGDDAAGLLVAAALERWRHKAPNAGGGPEWEVFTGHTAPENMTGEIKRFNPTHLVIVDAADIGGQPGEVRLIDPWQTDGPTFGTHKMPPNLLVEYLRQAVQCAIVIVALQHGGLEFGAPPSPEIRRAVRRVTLALRGALMKQCQPA